MKNFILITLIISIFSACSTIKPENSVSLPLSEQKELAKKYKYTNPEKSIYWYEKLVLENDTESIEEYAYANLFMINPIIIQDVKKAVELYEKLAKQNHKSSLMRLANIYEYGYFKNDIPMNKQKALEYYEKASQLNYLPAQKKLIEIYLCKKCNDGRYNKEKGLNLLKKINLTSLEEATK